LAALLNMKKSSKRIKSARKAFKKNVTLKQTTIKGIRNELSDFDSIDSITYYNTVNNSNENSIQKLTNETTVLSNHMKSILKELRCITNKIKRDEYEEEKSLDWKFAAMVIDRLCMILFYLATFITTCLILLTSKSFYKKSDPDIVI
jgi:hypothetical protein